MCSDDGMLLVGWSEDAPARHIT